MENLREDFPALKRKVNGYRLVYFDNTATTQKPMQVIDAVSDFYKNHNANAHRGIHSLSQEASEIYEGAHEKTAGFINSKASEVIFTKNTTESINLVARSLEFKRGDEIVVSVMEHHSNFLPWLVLSNQKGLKLRIVDVDDDGNLDMEDLKSKVSPRTKMVSISHVSNVLGTINPVREICRIARENSAYSHVDGAQSAPHMKIDVRRIGCDFFSFSPHKMLGPMGLGVLYGRREILLDMEPFLTGGGMIENVTKSGFTCGELPWKFEAGTPNVAGAAGFSAAIDYLGRIGMARVDKHGKQLAKYAMEKIDSKVYGPKKRAGIVCFNLDNVHAHDVAHFLDKKGIAVRSGNHCAQPLMERLGIMGAVRASFYIYNTKGEIDLMVSELGRIRRKF